MKISFALLCFKQILSVCARLEGAVAALLCTCHKSIHEQFTALLILVVHLHNLKLIYFYGICSAVRVWWGEIIHYLAQLQWNRGPRGLVTPAFCIRTAFFLFFDLPWYYFCTWYSCARLYIAWWDLPFLPSCRRPVVFFTKSDFSFGVNESSDCGSRAENLPFHQGSHCFALFNRQHSQVQNGHPGERLVGPRL